MDINTFGYAAVMYFSEDQENVFFETSKGYLISQENSLSSRLLRQSLLKPKSKQVKFEFNGSTIKIYIDSGFGNPKEIIFRDVSRDHKMDEGSLFMRAA